MAFLDEIRRKIEADEFEFSRHAVDQTIMRRISVREVREVFADRATGAFIAKRENQRP